MPQTGAPDSILHYKLGVKIIETMSEFEYNLPRQNLTMLQFQDLASLIPQPRAHNSNVALKVTGETLKTMTEIEYNLPLQKKCFTFRAAGFTFGTKPTTYQATTEPKASPQSPLRAVPQILEGYMW